MYVFVGHWSLWLSSSFAGTISVQFISDISVQYFRYFLRKDFWSAECPAVPLPALVSLPSMTSGLALCARHFYFIYCLCFWRIKPRASLMPRKCLMAELLPAGFYKCNGWKWGTESIQLFQSQVWRGPVCTAWTNARPQPLFCFLHYLKAFSSVKMTKCIHIQDVRRNPVFCTNDKC